MIAKTENGYRHSQSAERTRQACLNTTQPVGLDATGSASETNRNDSTAQLAGGAEAFWASLHHRITDQIAHGTIRSWLHAYAHLEPEERHGWPVLRLVLEARPPADLEAVVIAHHYRKALADSAGKAGPLADLARSLEVEL